MSRDKMVAGRVLRAALLQKTSASADDNLPS